MRSRSDEDRDADIETLATHTQRTSCQRVPCLAVTLWRSVLDWQPVSEGSWLSSFSSQASFGLPDQLATHRLTQQSIA